MTIKYDAIVVGAGPAGATAALELARGGARVLMLERGEYVGAKNTCGGMLIGRELGELVPEFWTEAPLERPVRSHRIAMVSGERWFEVEFDDGSFVEPPYNGFTVLRRQFDQWYAAKAQEAGATLVTRTRVDDLLYDGTQVVGVRTDRPDGDVYADVVIACDGVNSLIGRKAGLHRELRSEHVGLGVKHLLALPSEAIESRFGVADGAGAVYSAIGSFARGIAGGGFLYTNKDSVSVGMVMQPADLVRQGVTPYEVLRRFEEHPRIARLIHGGEPIEYTAHLVPEGGYDAMPTLSGPGVLLAGDAGGFVLNTGLRLMGLNLAMSSGRSAAKAALAAMADNDFSGRSLSRYRRFLDQDTALPLMRRHRKASALMASPRMFDDYPDWINEILANLVSSPGTETDKLIPMSRRERGDLRLVDLLRDGLMGVRAL